MHKYLKIFLIGLLMAIGYPIVSFASSASSVVSTVSSVPGTYNMARVVCAIVTKTSNLKLFDSLEKAALKELSCHHIVVQDTGDKSIGLFNKANDQWIRVASFKTHAEFLARYKEIKAQDEANGKVTAAAQNQIVSVYPKFSDKHAREVVHGLKKFTIVNNQQHHRALLKAPFQSESSDNAQVIHGHHLFDAFQKKAASGNNNEVRFAFCDGSCAIYTKEQKNAQIKWVRQHSFSNVKEAADFIRKNDALKKLSSDPKAKSDALSSSSSSSSSAAAATPSIMKFKADDFAGGQIAPSYIFNYIELPKVVSKDKAEGKLAVEKWHEVYKKKKQVQTMSDAKLRASEPYRKLTYELLTQYAEKRHEFPKSIMISAKPGYNLQHPELVLLINRKPFCAGGIQVDAIYFRGIEFVEKEAQEQLFGATRIILLHEITHLSERDYHHYSNKEKDNRFLQKVELNADTAALYVGNCTQCAQEYAQWLLDGCTYDPTVAQSLEALLAMGDKEFKEKLKLAEFCSLLSSKSNKSMMHPTYMHRALNAIQFSRNNSAQCKYHLKYGAKKQTKTILAQCSVDGV